MFNQMRTQHKALLLDDSTKKNIYLIITLHYGANMFSKIMTHNKSN